MKMLLGKRRRFDKGTAPARKSWQRQLCFEQMEERLTLSTTAASPGLEFQNTANIEGGLITVGNSQMLFQDRGVIDSDGLSSLNYSGTLDSVPILNFQGTDVIASGLNGGPVVPRGESSLDVLGGGLEHIAKIAPLESVAPSQPEGGQVQIAMLFDPFFELGPTPGAGRELAASTGKEPLGEAPENRSVSQEFAPVQGRDMAFEVASTSPTTAKSSDQISEFNEMQESEKVAPKSSTPTRNSTKAASPHEAAQASTAQPADQVPAQQEETPSEKTPQSTVVALSHVEHSETRNSTESVDESARDQVFAEWPEEKWQQRPAAVEAPTAPLAKDRERQVTPMIVLSGVAALSAGIHYARAHNRDSMKETEQLAERDE